MSDELQFIIESPQEAGEHTKRPRLVTSCDNCRVKKIKCLQPAPDSKCEACKDAKIPCRFRDRERYFEQRNRAICASSATPSSEAVEESLGDHQEPENMEEYEHLDPTEDASSSDPFSLLLNSPNITRCSSHPPFSTGTTSSNFDGHTRFQSYPPDPRSMSELSRRHGSSGQNSPLVQPMRPSANSIFLQNGYSISLFDPDQPQLPNYNLMLDFIHLFFEQLGHQYPFMNYEDTLEQFLQQTLSPLLSSCIASLAVRFSNLPELNRLGLRNVTDVYAENAKNIVSSDTIICTVGSLHSLILLSWAEYKNRRIVGFRAYCEMAMKMAVELGLSERSIQLHANARERNMLRMTWTSLLVLFNTASSWHV